MVTQQQWAFQIAVAGVYSDLEGQYELADFSPRNRTIRDATTIDHARDSGTKKYEFNRMVDGQDFSVSADFLPGQIAQDALVAAAGDNAGVDVRITLIGTARTYTYDFNALVVKVTHAFAGSGDTEGKEKVTFDFKVNSDVAKDDSVTV